MEDIKMKKTIFYLVAAMAVLACSKTEENEVTVDSQKPVYTLYGNIAQETGTKVVIHDNKETESPHTFSHYWVAGDKISVFGDSNTPEGGYEFTVPNKEGGYDNVGEFNGVIDDKNEWGETSIYAIYPYNESNEVAVDNGPTFTVTYPAAQTLTENSYDPNANVYVATGTGDNLTFYNTTAYLRLAIYTTSVGVSVSKIELTSLGENQPIAGTGTVTLNTVGNVTSSSVTVSGNATIILTPESSVSLDQTTDLKEKKLKYFYIAVPAVNYNSFGGYQIKIYSVSGNSETYQFRNISGQLSPNTVRLMSPLEYNPVSSDAAVTLLQGTEFKTAITNAAGDAGNIQQVVFVTNKNITGLSGEDVSATDGVPAIATYKNGVVTVHTTASTIKLNQYSSNMFSGLTALTTVDLSNVDASLVTTAASMFEGCTNLTNVTFGTNCKFEICSNVSGMFKDCEVLEALNINNFDINGSGNLLCNLQGMFSGCSALKTLDCPTNRRWVRFAANMSEMFQNCSSIKELHINGILRPKTTSNIQISSYMFDGCTSLETIDINPSNTDKVVDMSYMFQNCSNLKTINLLGTSGDPLTGLISTSSTTTIRALFYNCASLTEEKISVFDFNTSKVTNMGYVFYGCSIIKSLDLSGWDTKKVSTFYDMFYGCTNLETILLNGENCSSESVTSSTNFYGFILASNKMTALWLGENFNFDSVSSINYQFWPNPSYLKSPLVIYCTQEACQNMLQKGGATSGNAPRIVTGINSGKFVFKTLDGSADWAFYSDAELKESVAIGEVTKACYVGQAQEPTE